jgi:hypothetical protein
VSTLTEVKEERAEGVLGAFLLGLVLGIAVLGLVWFSVTALDDDNGEDEAVPASAGVSDVTSPSDSAVPEPTTAERCAQASSDLDEVLSVADPAMDQWKVHIGAMNQLVVGAITLEEASAFWEDTRLGAKQRIRQFERGMRGLREAGVDCPAADLAPADTVVRNCAREVDAKVRALRLVRTSIDTWHEHVGHMDMLRLGTMSPEEATEMWIASWQKGDADLRAYRLAAREADKLRLC